MEEALIFMRSAALEVIGVLLIFSGKAIGENLECLFHIGIRAKKLAYTQLILARRLQTANSDGSQQA